MTDFQHSDWLQSLPFFLQPPSGVDPPDVKEMLSKLKEKNQQYLQKSVEYDRLYDHHSKTAQVRFFPFCSSQVDISEDIT